MSSSSNMKPNKQETPQEKATTEISNDIPQKVISMASSYINDIRLKIASSLTSSMSESDRQQLFSSLNLAPQTTTPNEQQLKQQQQGGGGGGENVEEETKEPTSSIGEAVAEALAKEASRRESTKEQERIEIFQQAEKAAYERVQSDLLLKERKLALKRWEKELEDEKRKEEQIGHEGEEEMEMKMRMEMEMEQPHPILGDVLADFGYKRIHVISTKQLAAIPIWEKQRVYRHDRAKLMSKDKLKSMDIGLPGVIALHESLDGELAIIDGQHRVGMLAILESKNKRKIETNNEPTDQNLDLDRILVEVFPQNPSSSTTHAKDIFVEINKAEPVKLVDMPGVAKVADRRIINDAAMQLGEKFPDMFKASQRCHSPFVNIDNLRDAIFASGLLNKHKISTKTALLKWILLKNDELAEKYATQGDEPVTDAGAVKITKAALAKERTFQAALSKSKKFNFYLGLDSSWLHQ